MWSMQKILIRSIGALLIITICMNPFIIPFSLLTPTAWANWWGTEQELTNLYITENTTWNSDTDLSGYEHIYIYEDAQLTIEAGSHITLRHLVVIWGNIVAQGTIDNMITITRAEPHKNNCDPERDLCYDEYCTAGEYVMPALQFDAFADMNEDRESLFSFVKFEHMGIDHAFDDEEQCPAMVMRDRVRGLIAPSAYASEVTVQSPAVLYRSGKLHMKNCIFENNYTADIQIAAAYSDYLNTQGYVHIENSNFQNNSQNIAVASSFTYAQQPNEPDECVRTCMRSHREDPSPNIYVQCAISCMGEMDGVHDKSRVVLKNNWYGSISGPNTDQDPDFSYYGEKIMGDITYEPQDFRRSPDFASNVLFLPGIKASRLDLDDGDQVWLPEKEEDTHYLGMNNDGESANEIHAKNIVENAYGLVPVYDEFVEDLNDLRNDHAIKDFSLYAYDWRYDVEEIAKNGTKRENGTVIKPIDEIWRLAESSVSGKVTIVAHSNGGLLAKAIMQELERQMYESGREDMDMPVDNIIMVSSPQMGTPKAIASLLHGYDEKIAKRFITLMSDEQSRMLAEDMPGVYGLLPSKEYFARTQEPLITFDATVGQYREYKDVYGKEIENFDEFRNFALANEDHRDKPAYDDLKSANVLNEKIFDMETQLHDHLDAWTPPENVKLIQIGGWGLDTMRGITYTMKLKENCEMTILGRICTPTGEYESFYEVKPTVDGDGTVVTSSSLTLPSAENVERYWVDLFDYDVWYRNNRSHKDILEVDSVREFIGDYVKKHIKSEKLPQYITNVRPDEDEDMENPIRIRMSLYSPLDIHLYDEHSNHTGPVTEMVDGEEKTMIEENIPNSYYETIGEHKYVGWGTDDDVHVELDGYGEGSYTVKLQEIFVTDGGEEVGDTTEFTSLPTSADTKVNFKVLTEGIQDMSDLTADYDGDGVIDYTVTPQINGSASLTGEGAEQNDKQEEIVKDTKNKYKKASTTNWSAYQYTTKSASCPEKIALTLTGKHFDKDAIIRIGDVKAQKVKRFNNKKLTAIFCMNDLYKVKTESLRTISITNPHTKRNKAEKKIDIKNVNIKKKLIF